MIKEDKINILFTSVGRRSYLVKYFKEALSGNGQVYAANSSDISPAFEVADKSVVTPMIYDDNYIPFLIEYCKNNEIDAIVSLFDVDLPVLSANKELFKKINVDVIVSDKDVIDICNDKWETYQYLKRNGFNAPVTYIDLEEALIDINSNKITFPLMVKPRWGMGSIAVYEAENIDELKIFYKKVKNNILKTYLKYESYNDLDASVLIQEKLKGEEYGLDIINDLNKNHINTIVKKKIAMRSGETDAAVTVENETIKAVGERLGKTLGHIANLDVDVFLCNNEAYVLEMNARFGGGYPFSHMAGVNLPLAIIKWLRNEAVDIELLKAKDSVLGQKDINLVRLKNPCDIRQLKNLDLVSKNLKQFETEIVPSLTERNIDIEKYAEKLYDKGVVLAAYNTECNISGIAAAYVNNTETRESYLSFLAVSSDSRRSGIGKKLLEAIEKLAMDSEMKRVKLEVRKNNSNAIKFYEGLKYKIIGEASETSYYMTKEL